ncbi:MAG: peptide chain release factor N(5)-glutamine methyltransferase [Bacteroidota bacterium]
MTTKDLHEHYLRTLAPRVGAGEARSIARLILEDIFGSRPGQRPRELEAEEQQLAWTIENRIIAGEPVQYITGIADFYGLQLRVNPAVLIPRPETEELVELILRDHQELQRKVVDLGTGSGCIALALQQHRPGWEIQGLDSSEDALSVARANGERLDLGVEWQLADMRSLETSTEEQIDVIVSNPPYIPPSEQDRMGKSTVAFEPDLALYAPEGDPLLFYRHILSWGKQVLSERGQIYLECNEFNTEAVLELAKEQGYQQADRFRDLQGKWRMLRLGN